MSIRTVVTAVTGICWLAGCGGSGGNSPVAPPTPPTPPAMTDISAVQGSGRSSPLEGSDVTVAGVVTGDFQSGDADPRSLGGFYLQSETPDGDPATSDGIFIFEPSGMITDVAVGDRVEVDGEVEEIYDLENDPHELQNLALDPTHLSRLRAMRAATIGELRRTGARMADRLPSFSTPQ